MLDSVSRLSLAACDIGSLTTLSEMTKKELHAPVFQALGHCNCSNEPILAICEQKARFQEGQETAAFRATRELLRRDRLIMMHHSKESHQLQAGPGDALQ